MTSDRDRGIGCTVDPGPNHLFDNNKTEVLRLLLVLLSRQIYVSPAVLLSEPSLYTQHFIQKTSRRDVLTILCSLLNTALSPAQSAEMSVQNMAGKLPYNYLMLKGEDLRISLISTCFQVLVVLTDFQSGSCRDVVLSQGDFPVTAPTAQTNAFRYFLARIVSLIFP